MSPPLMSKRCETCNRTFSGAEAFCPFDAQPLVSVSADDPIIGRTIGDKYLLTRPIGQGGMGVVYAATQLSMDREVAIKLIKPANANDAKAVERFRAEARIVSMLRTPHVVTVHDFGQTAEGTLYLVMELLRGQTLRQYLKSHGPLELATAAPLWDQIARGLSEAHANNLVHRDIKPANIFLGASVDYAQFVKVLDFGVAAAAAPDGMRGDGVTGTGELPGTPAYLAPERIRSEAYDARADIYALGVIMYECLAGQRPFAGATSWDAIGAHLNDEVPPLHQVRPGIEVPGAVVDLVWRCLAKNPQLRPADGAAFRADLLAALAHSDDATWSYDTGLAVPPVGFTPEVEPSIESSVGTSRPSRSRGAGWRWAAGLTLGFVGGWLAASTMVSAPETNRVPTAKGTIATDRVEPSVPKTRPASAFDVGHAPVSAGSSALAADTATSPAATAVAPDVFVEVGATPDVSPDLGPVPEARPAVTTARPAVTTARPRPRATPGTKKENRPKADKVDDKWSRDRAIDEILGTAE